MGRKVKPYVRIVASLLVAALAIALLAGCGSGATTPAAAGAGAAGVASAKEARDILGQVPGTPTPEIAPRPTETPVPEPTATPEPAPTNTPPPTATPEATAAPEATTAPTPEPTATAEPAPTEQPADDAESSPESGDGDTGAGDADLVAQGEEIFQVTAGGVGCQFCHKSDATGLIGPDIRGKTAQNITDAIGGGVPDMAFLELTEDEIAAVAAYLATLVP